MNIRAPAPASKYPASPAPARLQRLFARISPLRWLPGSRTAGIAAAILLGSLLAACDAGLAPPDEPPLGDIHGVVTYVASSWPPPDDLHDLRFVALPFIPRDTADLFRNLDQLVVSSRLAYHVARDTFFIRDVPAGTYLYSGVAQQVSPALLDWRPVGLVEQTGGLVQVRGGQTTSVSVHVDFSHPPPFPPSQAR